MKSLDSNEVAERWPVAAPFVLMAGFAIVAAGLISAASAFSPSYYASWAAAYLILVVGFSQLVLGLGQAILAPQPPTRRTVRLEWSSFNLGNAGVLSGTLLDVPVLTVAGAILLAIALYLLLSQVHGSPARGWPLLLYRVVITVLFISIPAGLILAAFR